MNNRNIITKIFRKESTGRFTDWRFIDMALEVAAGSPFILYCLIEDSYGNPLMNGENYPSRTTLFGRAAEIVGCTSVGCITLPLGMITGTGYFLTDIYIFLNNKDSEAQHSDAITVEAKPRSRL